LGISTALGNSISAWKAEGAGTKKIVYLLNPLHFKEKYDFIE
jgi:hypothetical protein